MEQVSFDPLTSFYIFNTDQALLLESLAGDNLNDNTNSHSTPEVFNVVNPTIADNSDMVSESNDLISNNYCLLKKNVEEQVVELSVRDDFSVHLMETSSTKKDYETVTSSNSNGNGTVNEILELASSQGDALKQQYALVTSNDNLMYAVQINDVKMPEVSPVVSSSRMAGNIVKTSNNAPTRKSFILSGVSPSTLKGQKTLLNGMSSKICFALDTESTLSDAKSRLATAQDPKKCIPGKDQVTSTDKTLFGQRSIVSPLVSNGVKTMGYQSILKRRIFRNLKDIESCNPVQNNVQVNSALLNGSGNINNISRQGSAVSSEQITVSTSSPSMSTCYVSIPPESVPGNNSPTTPNQGPKRITPLQLNSITKILQNHRNKGAQPSNIYDPETNTRVVCRVFYPEDLMDSSKKRKACMERKGGRKKEKGSKEKPDDEDKEEEIEIRRTRSGRLSRPPKYIVKDYKNVQEETGENKGENNENALGASRNTFSFTEPSYTKRSHSATRFRCPTCGKIYLGIERMAHHFKKYPTHGDNDFLESLRVRGGDNQKHPWRKSMLKSHRPIIGKLRQGLFRLSDEALLEVVGDRVTSLVSPYDYLMLRARKEGGTRRLLEDLTSLLTGLATLAPSILHPHTDISPENSISVKDERLCRILNLPPGCYLPVDSGLRASNQEPVAQPPAPSPLLPEPPSLTPDLMDDCVISDILCQRSSFDSFDDIESERLHELIPSDDLVAGLLTAVDSQSLTHSLMSDDTDSGDSVSGSTEDLIRTLESSFHSF